jgi:hypothetical protein
VGLARTREDILTPALASSAQRSRELPERNSIVFNDNPLSHLGELELKGMRGCVWVDIGSRQPDVAKIQKRPPIECSAALESIAGLFVFLRRPVVEL